MNKYVLLTSAAILSATVATESWAEDCYTDENNKITCLNGIQKNDNNEYICGTDCTFTIVGDTLKVKANSANATIDRGIFSPYFYSGGKVVNSSGQEINFNKVELDGDFAYIGNFAFNNCGATITTTSGVLNVKDMGSKVFKSNTNSNTILDADVYISSNAAADAQTLQYAKINGDLIFADGVTTIIGWFMGGAKINGNVIIPDSVKNVGQDNFITLLNSPDEEHRIYCGAENCYELFNASCLKDTRVGQLEQCLNALSQLQENGQLSAYPDGCSKLDAGLRCQKCKSNNFKLNDGECDRIRYTPAEAAKFLRDDNTNVVTITFKHQ